MNLLVNGEPQVSDGGTLADLLNELAYSGNWLATAVNGHLVRAADRVAHPLADGDRIEILSPMQGG
jgi:sulfur carrier protein